MATSTPHSEVPSEAEPRSLDDLVADGAEVIRLMGELPSQRQTLRIPERAVRVVADLDEY